MAVIAENKCCKIYFTPFYALVFDIESAVRIWIPILPIDKDFFKYCMSRK